MTCRVHVYFLVLWPVLPCDIISSTLSFFTHLFNTLSPLFLLFPSSSLSLSYNKAQRSDELDITTDEELDVMEWDDGDGWCKGRNKTGTEGYFPQSYVQALTTSSLTIDSSSSSPPHSDYTTSGVTSGSGPSLSINDRSISNNEGILLHTRVLN